MTTYDPATSTDPNLDYTALLDNLTARPQLVTVPMPTGHLHPTEGDYVRRWWMPTLGPTATALLQLMADELADRDVDHIAWTANTLGRRVGVGHAGGRTSALTRSLVRLGQFRIINLDHPMVIGVPTHMPPITGAARHKLPPDTLRRHDQQLAAATMAAIQ